MIVDELVLIEYISKWLASYAKQSGRSLFVLNNSEARANQVVAELCHKATRIHGGLRSYICYGGFVECYHYADANNGVIVGSIDRTLGRYYRGYSKLGEGLADVQPLFDLEYSEIIQIYKFLKDKYEGTDPEGHEMIEFCNNAERTYGIITDEKSPHLHSRWPYFTEEQKKWIGIIHQREKKTRHKALNRPFPNISDNPNLCKRNAL
jgi:hypothetical protein